MTDTNATWRNRSLQAVWHPCTQMKLHGTADSPRQPLVPIVRADGVWLEDAEGQRYLDGISSWWVNLFGHNHPAIRAALVDQLERLDHVMLAGFTHPPVVELSERLAQLTGLGHAFYGSDGASATEIALKMSAHYWRNAGRAEKCQFVALEGGYHGETVGALGVTDIPLFRTAYAPLLRLAATVPSPDARRATGGQTPEQVADAAADQLEAWLKEHHQTTAALILEPMIQCAAGMAMHHPRYLQRVRALCDQYEVHLVADEIAVGFGRTGTMFAHQQAGIRPDFICLSKGLTGGTLPLSAVLTTDTVYQAFYDEDVARGFLHSHSYTGNPLACRAALATLDLFEQTGILEKNVQTSERLWDQFAPLTDHPRVHHARRLGMVFAWDVPNRVPDFAKRFAAHALARGAVLRPIGHTVYAMPPYVISEAEGALLAQAAYGALEATLAEEASGATTSTHGVVDGV